MALIILLCCTLLVATVLVQLSDAIKIFYIARRRGYQLAPPLSPLSLVQRVLISTGIKKPAVPVVTVVQSPDLFRKLGRKTFAAGGLTARAFSTADYENVRSILVTQNRDWGVQPMRLRAMKPLLGEGLLTTDGQSWQRSRSIITPSFAKSNIRELSKFAPYLNHLVSLIPSNGETVDLQPLLFKMFADTSQKFILGSTSGIFLENALSTDTLPPTYLAAFGKSFMIMSSRMSASNFTLWRKTPEHVKTFKVIHDIIDKLVVTALGKFKTEMDMTTSDRQVLRQTESMLEGVARMTNDRVEIRNQMIHGIMAAQDTLASVTGNTIFALSKNPSQWTALHKLMMGVEDGPDLADNLQKTKLLQNIIYESLRLYPIFPILGRVALKDTFLPNGGGEDGQSRIFVPAGGRALSHFYVLNRDPNLYGEMPDVFDPSRWDRLDGIHSRFMGFGAGPRNCLGKDKAMLEVSYVLWKLASEFSTIKSKDPGEWDGLQTLTCKNKNGCKVAFSR